jgi:hypothetical protein
MIHNRHQMYLTSTLQRILSTAARLSELQKLKQFAVDIRRYAKILAILTGFLQEDSVNRADFPGLSNPIRQWSRTFKYQCW